MMFPNTKTMLTIAMLGIGGWMTAPAVAQNTFPTGGDASAVTAELTHEGIQVSQLQRKNEQKRSSQMRRDGERKRDGTGPNAADRQPRRDGEGPHGEGRRERGKNENCPRK